MTVEIATPKMYPQDKHKMRVQPRPPLPTAGVLTVIEPRSRWSAFEFQEFWRFRELLFFLAWRDVKVRYKQTILGASWAVLQPLATMMVFVLCLGRIAEDPKAEQPYALFLFAGLLPWTFFANAINAASTSIIGNQNLITKVYFPRLIIPVSAIGASAVDFFIAFVMLLFLMLCYGFIPGVTALAVIPLSVGLALTAIGVGTFLSALTVAYRDFRHVIPFMVQLWMFATPAIYLQATHSSSWLRGFICLLNPVHGFVVNIRAASLGNPFDFIALAMSSATGVVLLLLGCLYFRQVERRFADII